MTDFKHSFLTSLLYNGYLDWRSRNVKFYVFVATTGRSGTKSLCKIFHTAKNVVAFHEPYPAMLNVPDEGPSYVRSKQDRFRVLKRTYVKRAAIGYTHYIETNHMFIKNFASEAVTEFGEKLRVIQLVRDPVAVACSKYRLEHIPGVTKVGRSYLLDPLGPENIVQIADILQHEEFSHHLYKCLWYWYEITARTEAFRSRHPGVPCYFFRTEDLQNRNAIMSLFSKLSMPADEERLGRVCGQRFNRKNDLKRAQITAQECSEMNDRLLLQLEKKYGRDFVDKLLAPCAAEYDKAVALTGARNSDVD